MPMPSFPRPQGCGVLASAWNREQGEPARLPWEQVQAMLASGASAEVGCWWWKFPDPKGPCTARPGWEDPGAMASSSELTESAWSPEASSVG